MVAPSAKPVEVTVIIALLTELLELEVDELLDELLVVDELEELLEIEELLELAILDELLDKLLLDELDEVPELLLSLQPVSAINVVNVTLLNNLFVYMPLLHCD